jgi:hypothetical protein
VLIEEKPEMKAKLLLCVLALTVATVADAAPDNSSPKCLMASLVDGTGVIDENTVIFRMKDGTVWKNTLRQSCPNLKFAQGFSEVIRSDEICANQQIIHVLGTGNVCQLGAFSRATPPKPQTN